jgi:hypothetical protein
MLVIETTIKSQQLRRVRHIPGFGALALNDLIAYLKTM